MAHKPTRIHGHFTYIAHRPADSPAEILEPLLIEQDGETVRPGMLRNTMCRRMAQDHWAIVNMETLVNLGVTRGACIQCLEEGQKIHGEYAEELSTYTELINPGLPI